MTPPRNDEQCDLDALHDVPPTVLSRHEAAYREGVASGIALLERLTALHEQSLTTEPPGRPTLAWELARGLLDVLQPGLNDSSKLIKSRDGARFVAELRSALLDDLTYTADRALQIARKSPPGYSSRPEEW